MRVFQKIVIRAMASLSLGAFAPAVLPSDAQGCAEALALPIQWADATERLVRCNPEVLLSNTAIAGARAERQIAGQIPNPQASFGAGSINPQRGIKGSNQEFQIDWLMRIDQLIERGGKRGLRIARAESGLLASRWQAAEARRTGLLALSHAWSELWSSQQREVLLDSALRDFQRIEEVSRIRLDAGDIAQADYSRVVIDLQRIENDRAQAQSDRIRAQQFLGFVLGLQTIPTELTLSGPWPALQAGFPDPDPLSLRPEIASAQAQLDQASTARTLARRLATRDVSVGVQADRYPAPAGDGNTVGVYFSVPLFAWHRFEGEIARAETEVTAAQINLQRLRQQAISQQAVLLQDRDIAMNRWRRLRENALPLGDRLSSSIRLAYEQRAISLLDMLDSLRVYRLLQADTLEARLQFEKSDALARALLRVSQQANDPVFRFVSVPETQP
jgi:cobalt-zinc-cadmium efflux system outer membrane protein